MTRGMPAKKHDKFLPLWLKEVQATKSKIDADFKYWWYKGASAADAALHSEGAPIARYEWLLKELQLRFPDPDPFSAQAYEGRLLKMIDSLLSSSPPRDKVLDDKAPRAKRYQPPPDQTCANCGKTIEGSDLALLSQAIHRHKPACSYECNKALGQVL